MATFFRYSFVPLNFKTTDTFGFRNNNSTKGFTLMELILALMIIATLAALSVLIFSKYIESSKTTAAITDIQSIQDEINLFETVNQRLPLDLSDIDMDTLMDPWGNPYQYTNFTTSPKGQWRKDKFMVPINSTYDLWSMGPDGQTQTPLTAAASRDDIIRANDGSFVGKVADY